MNLIFWSTWTIVNRNIKTTMQPLQPPSKALISRIRKLQTRKGREESGRFPAEGTQLVKECLLAGVRCHSLIFSDDFPESSQAELTSLLLPLARVTTTMMERPAFDRLCDTQTPQGVLGEFDQPAAPRLSLLESDLRLLVVLDEVQDPGNLGTSIRVAAGLGAGGVLLTRGCADLWNPKVVRATAGALFRIPVWRELSPEEATQHLSSAGYELWMTDAAGDSLFLERRIPSRLAIVMGNEAHGASEAWLKIRGSKRIGLPMTHGVESLNVGTALAAILGWVLGKGLSPD